MPDDPKIQQPPSAVDQKAAEEVLHQTQLVVESSYDAIISESLDNIITSWNGGAERMFGYSSEEVIGKSVLFLLPPEMKDEEQTLLNKIRKGEVIADYDTARLRKDGSRIDVAISLSPIKMEDGTIIGASIVERNITKRKKSEEVLRQIQLIVDNSYDAIIGETLAGIITSWNGGAKRMLGYSSEEVIGKSVLFLLPLERQNEIRTLLNKIRAGETVADYDTVRVRKDGLKIDVALSISPVKSGDGTIIGASIVERDITERRASELHIKELNEVRNKFIAIISHQLRTPLAAVNWNLEMILNGDFGKLDETQRKFLQSTHHASIEITRRIHNLLTAIDIEEKRVQYNTEEVVLNSLCAGVVNEALKKCELKNLSCIYTPPTSNFSSIDGDGEKIRMAMAAVVENAIGYTKDNGKITITLRPKGDAVQFEVTDTGIGIPQAEQHFVFTRFFRASNASLMQTDAFGLGLFIAKNFIEQHHGKIGFESKEGEGSTFWFDIPLKK